jgi:hypothetical protein
MKAFSPLTLLLLSLTAFGEVEKSSKPPIDWGGQDIVVIGEVKKVRTRAIGVKPKMFSYNLEVRVEELLRGDLSNKKAPGINIPKKVKIKVAPQVQPEDAKKEAGKLIQIRHSVRQEKEPVFPEDLNQTRNFIALAKEGTVYRFIGWEALVEEREEQVRFECTLPFGWKGKEKEIFSPWSELKSEWPQVVERQKDTFFCMKTGRPFLDWNDKATMTVAKVPSVYITNLNRDGDGEMRVTVSNLTGKRLTIPALRRVGERILWKESLVLMIKGRAFRLPGSKGISFPTDDVELAPSEEISTVINPLTIRDADWPTSSAERIYFQFCLGRYQLKSPFYYYKEHHDSIRRKLMAGQPLRPLFLGD